MLYIYRKLLRTFPLKSPWVAVPSDHGTALLEANPEGQTRMMLVLEVVVTATTSTSVTWLTHTYSTYMLRR